MTEPKAVDQTKQTNVLTSKDAFEITSLEDSSKWLKILIYGPYGSGKTTLAASAADVEEMSDVLYADIESGSMSIRDNDRIEMEDNINIVKITTFKQLATLHEFLKAHCAFRDVETTEAEDKLKRIEAKVRNCEPEDIKKVRRYRTVVIDSLSELDQLSLYELLGIQTDMTLDHDFDIAGWDEYRKNNQMIQLVIRAYRDLPINVIFVCSTQYTQDEQKRMHFTPSLTGKLKSQVQGFVDIVGYLIVGTQSEGSGSAPRRMYVQPVGKFDAKNRKASFKESFFEDPVMKDIYTGVNNKSK